MGVTRYLLGSECVLIVISVYFRLRLTVRTGQLLQFQIPCRNLNYPLFNCRYYTMMTTGTFHFCHQISIKHQIAHFLMTKMKRPQGHLLLNTDFEVSLSFTCAVFLGYGLALVVILLTFCKADLNFSPSF